ncbi:choice-of-anchor tandem repeat GloVer-containing protein [Chlamydiota bacterium]
MKICLCILMFSFLCLYAVSLSADEIILLHEFAGGVDDGKYPIGGNLLLSGGVLYGATTYGGDSDLGVIFSMSTNGDNFNLLHEFTGKLNDGSRPAYGDMILDGETLYGMTRFGGLTDTDNPNGKGAIFSMDTDGSNYNHIYEFTGGINDGKNPYNTNMALHNNTLYGVTSAGGNTDVDFTQGKGVIFSVTITGSNYTVLHKFAGGASDGEQANNGLVFLDSKLYGMTTVGGGSDLGVIYSIDLDGSNFNLLHEFKGGVNDGRKPVNNLTVVEDSLYGMTFYGGDNDIGVIFSIDPTDTTSFALLYEFAGAPFDGDGPRAILRYIDGTLYGMTQVGGGSDLGTIFSIDTDGDHYNILYSFTGGVDDGSWPMDSLTLSSAGGNLWYGMTFRGGDANFGVVFGKIPEPTTIILLLLSFLGLIGKHVKRKH